jgi:hypothetical protein
METQNEKPAPIAAGPTKNRPCRIVFLFLFWPLLGAVHGMGLPPGGIGGGYTNTALDNWSFTNTVSWTSDKGYAPVSFTNLSSSDLGNGNGSLVVDSTNAAWVQYNVVEADGRTNLAVGPQGTIMFWFAPNWTDTNNGGTGPGQYGRFIEVGSYTTNASYGWWSLYLDPAGTNVYFAAQTNDGSQATFLSAPIAWDTTNRWHLLALTYSSTNSAFYVDGHLITNGAPVTIWPGPDVLANGFYIGSDNTGTAQVHGIIDDVATYNYPLNQGTIAATFIFNSLYYYANPMNRANFAKASSYPTNTPTFSVVAGSGGLTNLGPASGCVPGGNSVWLTNAFATNVLANTSDASVNLIFTIAGGYSNVSGPFDVFAIPILGPTAASSNQWTWMGQGYACYTYMLTNMSPYSAFIRLGTPLDSNGDGLTDAYCLLVLRTDPYTTLSSANDGIPDAWKVLWNLSTSQTNLANLDPDFDGLTNLKEYLYGSRPLTSEGFNVWVGSPSAYSGIP